MEGSSCPSQIKCNKMFNASCIYWVSLRVFLCYFTEEDDEEYEESRINKCNRSKFGECHCHFYRCMLFLPVRDSSVTVWFGFKRIHKNQN